jgi:hypothetical protein
MMRRSPIYHRLITLLALSLQAVDALVMVAGHSHEDCDEHQVAAAANECEPSHHDGLPASTPEDDCTICRHIGQPVVPVLFTIELVGSGRIEACIPPHPPAVANTIAVTHPARGPPLLSA